MKTAATCEPSTGAPVACRCRPAPRRAPDHGVQPMRAARRQDVLHSSQPDPRETSPPMSPLSPAPRCHQSPRNTQTRRRFHRARATPDRGPVDTLDSRDRTGTFQRDRPSDGGLALTTHRARHRDPHTHRLSHSLDCAPFTTPMRCSLDSFQNHQCSSARSADLVAVVGCSAALAASPAAALAIWACLMGTGCDRFAFDHGYSLAVSASMRSRRAQTASRRL